MTKADQGVPGTPPIQDGQNLEPPDQEPPATSKPQRSGPRQPNPVRRRLLIFYGVAALALILVGVGAVLASRTVARNQAFKEAEGRTARTAEYVVKPLVPGAFFKGSAADLKLHADVNERIGDELVQITIWRANGQVAWASDPKDTGRELDLPAEARAAITMGVTTSVYDETTEVGHPELSPTRDGFVEVYVPFKAGQEALALEAYYDYAQVDKTANALLRQILPLALIPLILLQIIQVPIATSMARRIQRQEAERLRLLEQSLTASEKERIRIAADLHDGPIQDMAGIGYALGAMSASVAPVHRALMATVQTTVRRSIDSMRRLVVDLYPPDLEASRLPTAIADLTVPLDDHGIDVRVDVQPLGSLAQENVTALYRVAREALANVIEHSYASHAVVTLETGSHPGDRQGRQSVLLRIEDDGVGIDVERQLDRRTEGHYGLTLLGDRIRSLGGTLEVTGGEEGGTVVTAVLPLPADHS